VNYAAHGALRSTAIFTETFFAKNFDKVRVCSPRVQK
jgi:hypothetical protein